MAFVTRGERQSASRRSCGVPSSFSLPETFTSVFRKRSALCQSVNLSKNPRIHSGQGRSMLMVTGKLPRQSRGKRLAAQEGNENNLVGKCAEMFPRIHSGHGTSMLMVTGHLPRRTRG